MKTERGYIFTLLYTDFVSEKIRGFRSGHPTCDNIFILHRLISLYLGCGKKNFCCFVDFSKAFDTVWRAGI
jgi:hypothetical protein